MPQFKSGVVMWDMHPSITDAMPALDRVSVALVGRDALITTARDGTHSKTSLHYKGRAVDLRINDIPRTIWDQYRDNLAAALGDDWDVVLEPDHIHVEFDPH